MSEHQNYIDELAAKIRSRIDPDKLPDDGLDQLFASYALLALSKGEGVTNEDVHDAWSTWATEFDSANPALVPFDELSSEAQAQDTLYRDAIREVSRSLE